jgi:xanthine/CO dehydrogenase XdhC/CoxF family maturation factor
VRYDCPEAATVMGEFESVSRPAIEARQKGETVALATVISVMGSAPRYAGARMLVWPNGRTLGTVGGATLELRVIEHAMEALAAGRSRLGRYVFSTHEDAESVGLVASPIKARVLGGRLVESGLVLQALAHLWAPTGLDLGAKTPGEIALSILAEIQQVRRGASGRLLSEIRRQSLASHRVPEAD